MTAWRIGTDAGAAIQLGTFADQPEDRFKTFLDRLTMWIPGDILAIYAPGVTALTANGSSMPSVTFLLVMIAVTPLVVVAGHWAAQAPLDRALAAKTVLATIAFTIWSISIPYSGWQRWNFVSDNRAATAIGAAIAGLLFGHIADGVVRRLSS